MSEVVACPACRRPLEPPLPAPGATIQCPACGCSFVPVPPPEQAGIADAPTSRRPAVPTPPRRRDEPFAQLNAGEVAAWKRVRRGVLFLPLAVFALATACFAAQQAEGALERERIGAVGFLDVPLVALSPVILGCCALIHLVCAFGGEVSCLYVPNREHARTWALAGLNVYLGFLVFALVLAGMNLAWGSVGRFLTLFVLWPSSGPGPTAAGPPAPDVGVVASLIPLAVLMATGRFLALLGFLRAVALQVRATRLARRLAYLLGFAVLLGALFVAVVTLECLVNVASVTSPPSSPGDVLIPALDLLVLFLMFLPVWVVPFAAVVLIQVRNAVSDYLKSRPRTVPLVSGQWHPYND